MYRCDSCWFEPRCIAQPESADDVSKVLLTVTFFGVKFAVRSGGHNPNPGFGGIDSPGILIDMSRMNTTSLSPDGAVASLGPGSRFGDVYSALNAQGKTVMAGRLNSVGLGGYFLGGGLTYFSSRYGLAADNIVNYEASWYSKPERLSYSDMLGRLCSQTPPLSKRMLRPTQTCGGR